MANKVNFGLKNAHYATFTVNPDDTITYDTPKPLPGSVELSLEPRGEMTEFYADDMLYYSASNNQGYEGTFSLAVIPESFAVDVLEEEKHATDMVLTEKATAKGKPFALIFEFDGDVKATRHVLYNCTANRPTVTGATKTDSVEVQPNELTFVASPRSTDGAVKTKTTENTPAAVYDAWYSTVYNTVPDTTPPTVTVSPTDGATAVAVDSNIVWTFSEAIRDEDVNDGNFYVMQASDGTLVAGTLSIDATKEIVTFDPTSNLTALTEYIAVASKNVRDLAGNQMTANSVTNFTTA